jgi:thiol-disulfide isomerase/thioredoxin
LLVVVAASVLLVYWYFISGSSEPVKTPIEGNWLEIELIDVITQENFSIADFKGVPVILESFAVWCPTCLEQQREIRDLKSNIGDIVVYISVDTDPNEDEALVIQHLQSNNLDWNFTVAPSQFTEELIDNFGLSVVNAPGAPVVIIWENQNEATFLQTGGVKSAETLQTLIEEGNS